MARVHAQGEALGLTRAQATPYEAGLILVQAGWVLAIIAILEGVGRGRPGRP